VENEHEYTNLPVYLFYRSCHLDSWLETLNENLSEHKNFCGYGCFGNLSVLFLQSNERGDSMKDEIVHSLRHFKEMNRKKYRILRMGFFGSAARGGINEHSDIDVVVELEEQDLFLMIGIRQDLEEQFDKPVDVVSYREKMNPFLKNRIDKEAVYV
jgi:predicted nucleotidyltransferase